MVWQDIVITIVIIAFSYALLTQIYQRFKQKKGLINLQTSSITAFGMYLFTIVHFTLKLYFSAIVVFLTAILWTILFAQNIAYK